MPYCSDYGIQNTDTAKFCVNCGAAVQNTTTGQKTNPQSSLPLQQLSIGSNLVGSLVLAISGSRK